MKKLILLFVCFSFVMPAFAQSMFPQDNTDAQIQALRTSGQLKTSQKLQTQSQQNYYVQQSSNQTDNSFDKVNNTVNQVNTIKSSVKSLLNY